VASSKSMAPENTRAGVLAEAQACGAHAERRVHQGPALPGLAQDLEQPPWSGGRWPAGCGGRVQLLFGALPADREDVPPEDLAPASKTRRASGNAATRSTAMRGPARPDREKETLDRSS